MKTMQGSAISTLERGKIKGFSKLFFSDFVGKLELAMAILSEGAEMLGFGRK